MNDQNSRLTIPGESGFWVSRPPPMAVTLPVRASVAGTGKLRAAHLLVMGLVCSLLALITVAATFRSGFEGAANQKAVMAAVGVFLLAFTILVMVGGVLRVKDCLFAGPLLEVYESGISDRRLSIPIIVWRDIESIGILPIIGSVVAVRLSLRSGRASLADRLRFATTILDPAVLWSAREHEVRIDLSGLDHSSHVLLQAMTAMVVRHGGSSEVPPHLAA
jgi:hypothetical protein